MTEEQQYLNASTIENGERKEKKTIILETDEEKRDRMWSLRIIYFTMFLISLGFSIVLTGIWPYLDKLDPHAGKEFMGLIVAANPLGQMVFSPIFGYWSNKMKSIRFPLMASMAIFCISSGVYSTLYVFDSHVKYWMFIARFFVGVSSANIAVCRSYLSAATTVKERTNAVSMMSLAQVLGFVFGPALQAAVTPLGTDGYIFYGFVINMYTAAGWANVLLGVINFILFLPYFFRDCRIAAKEQMLIQGKETEKETWKSVKIDYMTAWTLILSFFVISFNFVLLETLGTSLAMDQFAWTKSEALYYMGALLSVGAFVACVAFLLIPPLCRRYSESDLLIWGGFFIMVLGRFIFIPYRGDLPKLAVDRKYVMENGTFGYYDEDDPMVLGCPSTTQPWCATTLQLQFPEFLFGYMISAVGYPIGVTLIQTIFSKILGSRPQGTWMGLFTGAGCVSRIFGPLAVGSFYTRYGTTWIFSVTCAMMIFPMVWLYFLQGRLRVEEKEIKIVEMKNLNGNGSLSNDQHQNGTNGYIKDKTVIINEDVGEKAEDMNLLRNGS